MLKFVSENCWHFLGINKISLHCVLVTIFLLEHNTEQLATLCSQLTLFTVDEF